MAVTFLKPDARCNLITKNRLENPREFLQVGEKQAINLHAAGN